MSPGWKLLNSFETLKHFLILNSDNNELCGNAWTVLIHYLCNLRKKGFRLNINISAEVPRARSIYPGVSGTENEKPQMSRVLKNGLGVIVLNAWRSTLTSRNIRATTNDQTCENTKQDFLILAYIVHSCCFLDYFPVSCTCFPTS